MDYNEFHQQLKPFYDAYNGIIKPLIAEIEVRYEQFPTQIYNEIRAFNDHVARCYGNFSDDECVKEQLKKAKGHIDRAILDCYKFLNVHFHDDLIIKFDKKTKRIDLTAISDGTFYTEYKNCRQYVIENLKKAKLLESKEDKSKSMELYELVHNKYFELEKLIDINNTNINWARAKFFFKNRLLTFLIWAGTIIVSTLVGAIIQSNFNAITDFFKHLFVG